MECAVRDSRINEAIAERQKCVAIRDCAEYQRRVNFVFGDEFTGGSDASVNSLNGLMSEREV